MKKLIALILVLTMALSLAACGTEPTQTNPTGNNPAQTQPNETPSTGAGVTFTVVVTDLEGNETSFEITSDKATVGEALVEEGLIEGHESEFGLYVDAVNGVALDWDKDGKYWAFYINGEYAMTGVDTTEITAGATYSFKPE